MERRRYIACLPEKYNEVMTYKHRNSSGLSHIILASSIVIYITIYITMEAIAWVSFIGLIRKQE